MKKLGRVPFDCATCQLPLLTVSEESFEDFLIKSDTP